MAASVRRKVEPVDDEKQEKSNDQMIRRITTPIPIEVIQENILSRLPVKSLLRSRCVSKTWRALISDPRFLKIHYNHTVSQRFVADGSALFIYAYDLKGNWHLLSAGHHGGEVSHLLTLPFPMISMNFESMTAEHLNGLMLIASRKQWARFVAILNPSTRKICKLPDRVFDMLDYSYPVYLFGFDETTNEHKVLQIRFLRSKDFNHIIDFSIFTLSTNSWRKIDVELPSGIDKRDFQTWNSRSVCVNSVIHLLFHWKKKILTFDLRKETFSEMKVPVDALPYLCCCHANGTRIYRTFLTKIGELLGLFCYLNGVESDETHILILKDYENGVWVKEIITFPVCYISLGRCFPSDVMLSTGEIIFTPVKVSRATLRVLVYDMKCKRFRCIDFTLGTEPLQSDGLKFELIRSYYENLIPFPSEISQGL